MPEDKTPEEQYIEEMEERLKFLLEDERAYAG